MAWDFRDIYEFRDRVNTISSSVRSAQWTTALEEWQLGKLIDLSNSANVLTDEDINRGYRVYQPQVKLYVAGDVSPMTCKSDPAEVSLSTGSPLQSKVNAWEVMYQVCQRNKNSGTLEDFIAEQELATAVVMGGKLFNLFWYGSAENQNYGVFTHPLAVTTPTPAPATPEPGLTNFQSKAGNEIYGELAESMTGMAKPRLAISAQAWDQSADKILGGGDNCNRVGDCILKSLATSQATGDFTGTFDRDIFRMKWLDDVTLPGGAPSNGVYIVWDEDAVSFPFADPSYLGAVEHKKRVDRVSFIDSAGFVLKFEESLRIVTGINEIQP